MEKIKDQDSLIQCPKCKKDVVIRLKDVNAAQYKALDQMFGVVSKVNRYSGISVCANCRSKVMVTLSVTSGE